MGRNRKEADRIAKKVVVATADDILGLALDIHGELIENTPVDTGHARINWTPSIAAPVTGEIEGGDQAKAEIQASGINPLVAFAPARLGDPLYITNNVPYIRKLDKGHSTKRGFVGKAIRTAIEARRSKKLT